MSSAFLRELAPVTLRLKRMSSSSAFVIAVSIDASVAFSGSLWRRSCRLRSSTPSCTICSRLFSGAMSICFISCSKNLTFPFSSLPV